MPSRKIYELLERELAPYEVVPHPASITAQETALAARIPDGEFAKATILKADGRFVMAVLGARQHVDLERIRALANAEHVELASEDEFVAIFPDCECGAEPPFGNLYGLDVFVDSGLAANEKIAFNGGTHRQAIRTDFETFRKLVEPRIASFAFTPYPSEAGAWGG